MGQKVQLQSGVVETCNNSGDMEKYSDNNMKKNAYLIHVINVNKVVNEIEYYVWFS